MRQGSEGDPQVYGQVIASIWVGRLPLHRMGFLYFAGLLVFGAGIALFSLQITLLATIPFLVMEGVGEAFFTIGGKSILQDLTPNGKLGRMMSFRIMSERLGLMSGVLISGILAELFSVEKILMVAGFGLVALALPQIKKAVRILHAVPESAQKQYRNPDF